MHRYLFLLLVLLLASFSVPATPQNQTQNVILITLDGARSQEICKSRSRRPQIYYQGRPHRDVPLYKE
jgi:hypothetical protein